MSTAPAPPLLPPPLLPPEVVRPAWLPFVSNTLLFTLVCSLAATVDVSSALKRPRQLVKGVSIAMFCQFLLLPFVGFVSVRIFDLDAIDGVMLQVVVSSPGGAYSNWWCSLFNADLSLSVAATACSTLLSAALLPLNLLIYVSASYGSSILDGLRWDLLLLAVGVVTAAVSCGLLLSWHIARVGRGSVGIGVGGMGREETRRRQLLYYVGNVAGLCLVSFSLFFSSVDEPVWDKPLLFYAAVGTPALAAVLASTAIASLPCLRLSKPERVAVVIECLFQNIGIANSIALSAFSGAEASRAAGTPLFYGACQFILIPLYLLASWRLGWTYAPASEPFWRMLRDSYQHLRDEPRQARPASRVDSPHGNPVEGRGTQHETVSTLPLVDAVDISLPSTPSPAAKLGGASPVSIGSAESGGPYVAATD